MTIAEVKNLQDKQMITQVSGRVTRVGSVRTGEGNYGPWTAQDFDLEDATGKIKVTAWDHPALTGFMGKVVVLTPTRSDKGWNGLTAVDNNYQGNVTKQIKVTKTGVIEEMPTGPGAAPEADKPSSQAALTPSEKAQFHPASSGNGKIPWADYMTAMTAAHTRASFLERDDPQARAALVNTAMIAFSKGQVALPTQEDLDKEVPF
jgi:hypothetical protein